MGILKVNIVRTVFPKKKQEVKHEFKPLLRTTQLGFSLYQNIAWVSGEVFSYDNLGYSEETLSYLRKAAPNGIYQHQVEGIRSCLNGENVCLTTSTASGKSLVFYVMAIETLLRNPKSRIIAIYPLKALAREQEEKWCKALQLSGLKHFEVGRIDGATLMHERVKIVNRSHILILTPDIIHAWLMYNLSEKSIIKFLSNIKVIIVDEIHNYTGVFGSNTAYLFRRLRHVLTILGSSPIYICASATIADPEKHLEKLFGLDFKVISSDTSPKHELTISLVSPPRTKDMLTNLSEFLSFIAEETHYNFIAFVDSRKQTEYITSIISRKKVMSHLHFTIIYRS